MEELALLRLVSGFLMCAVAYFLGYTVGRDKYK